MSLSTQEAIRGLDGPLLAKGNCVDLGTTVGGVPQESWGQLHMDGYNLSSGKFVLAVWVFLNMCPEAAAICPFLESKQAHRGVEVGGGDGIASWELG